MPPSTNTTSLSQSPPALGFLTIDEHPEHGLFGGYLVVNGLGRPLEFHCTAPVKPNRAQEILYGATLAPFMYGEQIGRTLVEKAKTEPLVVCTDAAPALGLRDHTAWPVVWIQIAQQDLPPPSNDRIPTHSVVGLPPLHLFLWRAYEIGVLESHPADERDFRQRISENQFGQPNGLDLMEPFSRIREAIAEAQKSARSAA